MNPAGLVGGGGKGDGTNIVASKPPLRTPKDTTVSRLVNGVVTNAGGDSLNSNLSATAATFVPSASTWPNNTLNASAPAFVPRSMPNPAYQTEPTTTPVDNEFNLYAYVMFEFEKMIEILISQPGNMEEYMKKSLSHLLNVDSTDILVSMVDTLYAVCINEPNFRYTGARICQYFHTNEKLKSHPIFKDFKTCMLKRCKKDFDEREALLQSNEEEIHVIQGLAMFMSELFLNLETIASNGKKSKFEIIGVILKSILLSLLNHPTDKNIKCSVQMLKLSGSSIEEVLKNKGDSLDDVINCLASLQNSPIISDNSKFMIKSVLDLRCSNWGRSDSVSSTESLATDFNNLSVMYENEPVYFNQQGQQISRSEAGCPDDGFDSSAYHLNEEEDDFFFQQENEAYFDPNTYTPWSYDNFSSPQDLQGSEDYTVTEVVDHHLTNDVIDAYEAFLEECQDKKS